MLHASFRSAGTETPNALLALMPNRAILETADGSDIERSFVRISLTVHGAASPVSSHVSSEAASSSGSRSARLFEYSPAYAAIEASRDARSLRSGGLCFSERMPIFIGPHVTVHSSITQSSGALSGRNLTNTGSRRLPVLTR